MKEQIWAIAAPLAQNLESEECLKYPAHDSKSIPGQTKKVYIYSICSIIYMYMYVYIYIYIYI